jgi:chromosomal replication initiator protein
MGYSKLENELYEKWDDILENLRINFDISDPAFNTFIKILKVHSISGKELTILIDDAKVGSNKNFIEKRYSTFLQVTIEEMTNVKYDITYISKNEINNTPVEPFQKNTLKTKDHPSISKKYTFDNFVVGDNNDYAHAASLKVAEEPGGIYNPLFIYGGAGLGKTHLMHAIGNYILNRDDTMRIVYVTSESFVNEIVDAIRDKRGDGSNSMQEFRNKYRNIDVLLIDDIQFIIGKETMQQEFFHTFNHLYESQKQIVISSDKHPATMKMLEERLRSRFEMGLTVDIKPPTYETRMAILRRKVQEEHLSIDDAILDYIASNVSSNIRELQGAITKVIAFSKLRHKDITMDLAKEALVDMITPDKKKEITIDYIIETVADHFNISTNDLLSSKRSNNISHPRQICMYLCCELTNNTLDVIKKHLNRKDHSTIIHGRDNIKKLLEEEDSKVAKDVDILIKKINPQ